jgi:NDP-sugar pyrophosphorylase family protein
MKKIIILSGHSNRFLEKGYPIKPLININNELVIEKAVRSVYENELDYKDYIFIIKKTDIINFSIDDILKEKFKNCQISEIDDHFLGPVYSVKQIFNKIPEDENIVICYCDIFINWDFSKFIEFAKKENCDGIIASHNEWHPHRIHNNYFAYMKVTDSNDVIEIKEKESFTDNPINEFASSGIYFFKNGLMLKKYFNELIEKDIKVNNEFYVTLPFNLMIKDGLNVKHFVSENYFCLGTPKDIEIIIACNMLIENLKDYSYNAQDLINYFEKYFN